MSLTRFYFEKVSSKYCKQILQLGSKLTHSVFKYAAIPALSPLHVIDILQKFLHPEDAKIATQNNPEAVKWPHKEESTLSTSIDALSFIDTHLHQMQKPPSMLLHFGAPGC